jgi:hypothetical protein
MSTILTPPGDDLTTVAPATLCHLMWCCLQASQFIEKRPCGLPHRNLRLRILLAFALAGAALAQQGTADAIVVKIPSASMPSTVTLSTSGGNGLPGQQVTLPITLSLNGTAPASLQLDLSFDPTLLTFASATGLSATVVSAGDVRLSTGAPSLNGIASGLVANVTFTLAASFGAFTAVNLVNCMSADPAGNPLSTGCLAGTVGPLTCATVAEVQSIVNQALGIASPTNDINGDGVVNVIDVQMTIATAMNRACIQ